MYGGGFYLDSPSLKLKKDTVDGKNPAPPGMYETL